MQRIGVIGCGDVAQRAYLSRLASHDPRRHLVALADPVDGRATALAQKYGIPRAYINHKELLASDVDVVVNLTPIQVHASVTLDAIGAGKHVYTEKPIATTSADADSIIDAARKQGVTVAAAPAGITHHDVQQAIHWIHAGALGKICFIRARASHPGPDRMSTFVTDPSWFYAPGAGPLFDMGVYPLQVITAALGPARRVSAFSGKALPQRKIRYGEAKGKMIDIDIDDNTHLMLDFGNGSYATLDATYCVLSSKGPRMEIYGETGVLNLAAEIDDPPITFFRYDPDANIRGWLTPETHYSGRANPPEPVPAAEPFNLADGAEHLVQYLEGETELLLTAEHARHILDIMLSALESAKTGNAVPLTTDFPMRHL